MRAKSLFGVLVVVILLGAAGSARASVITIGSQATFSSLGTITQNTNWDAYPEDQFTFPGSPFVVGDLTFVEGGQNLIVGRQTFLAPVRNLFTDNNFAGTTIQIAGTHNLFAVNAGNIAFGAGNATFDITTNLSTYHFIVPVPDGTLGLQFFGFQAGPGEFFTSFAFSGANAPGVTDVQLGSTAAAAVPEPGTLLLLGTGLAAVVARRRSARRV